MREVHKLEDSVAAFVRRLTVLNALPENSVATLERIIREHTFRAKPGEDLICEGDTPSGIWIMLSGWAFRYKALEDGRRQVVSFLLPMDICDTNSLLLKKIDHSVGVMSNAIISELPQQVLNELFSVIPELMQVLWREFLVETAIQREWVVNLGRRMALERVAHLICELFERLRTAGLVENDTCDLPATQMDLADATGLSVVHLNRTLQELRAAKLITFRDRALTVHDFEGLKSIAMFDPSYLQR